MAYIYQILNKANNKKYIGQTINFKRRKKRHLTDLRCHRHDNKHLQNAFDKYGEDSFEFSILYEENCSQDRLNELEEYYIEKYDTYLNGYNCNRGGQQHNGFESKLKREDIFKIKAMLEFHKRPGTILGKYFHVSNTTIYRINKGESHEEYSKEYEKLSYLQKEKIYLDFCNENNIKPKITKDYIKCRKISREQCFIVYIYDEYGNGKRYYYAKDFNLNDEITRNVKNKKTCKEFYEVYKKLLFEEKIEILCRYIEKYNRKPPELLEYLFNKDNQQPS